MKIKRTVVVSSPVSSPPLAEPDERISRIRLSMVVHRTRYRSHALCGAAQRSWKHAGVSCRCYLPRGSHRTALCFAVHIDQVRPLRSSPVTSLRRYYEPLRLLLRPDGPHGFSACARRWTLPPTGGDLILYANDPSGRSAPADPAAVMTGHTAVEVSPARRGVYLGPVLTAFAVSGAARLYGLATNEAHSMGFTFVADCPASLGCSPPALADTQLPGLLGRTT